MRPPGVLGLAMAIGVIVGAGARGDVVVERGLPRRIDGAARPPLGFAAPRGTGADSTSFHGPFVPSMGDSAREYSRPRISVGPDDRVYVAYRILNAPEGDQALILGASDDGAYTWQRFAVVDDTVGRAVADPAAVRSLHGGGVAWTLLDSTFAWQIRFSRFAESGMMLSSSVRVDDGLPLDAKRDVPRLIATREALVCTWTHRESTFGWRGGAATRSFDGGRTWERRTEIIDSTATAIPWGGPFLARGPDDAIYASIFTARDDEVRVYRSLPTDTSWTFQGNPDDPSIDLTGGIAVSALAVSPEGEVGIAFETEEAGLPDPRNEVRFSTSTDEGRTWSVPFEVSAAAGEDRNHFEPKLVCDRFGTWHLAWITNGFPDILLIDILYSRLAVGDSVWSTPVRVNPDAGTVNAQAPFSLGLAVDEDGHVYITWGHQINSTAIYVATTRARPYDPFEGVVWSQLPVAPNPSRGAATVVVPIEASAKVTVWLVDVAGRLLRTWDLGVLPRGTHPVTWGGRDGRGVSAPAGVYYWRVERRGPAGVSTLHARSVRLGG